MKIHSDILEHGHLVATLPARVYAKPLRCGSRKRDHGFIVYLEGSSPRRSQHDRDAYAATWDEWGIWIAALYDIDTEAIIGTYESREDFYDTTALAIAAGWGATRGMLAPWLRIPA